MDRLNYFLRDVDAPDELARRTREYLRYSQNLVRKQSFESLITHFAPRLRGDILGHISMTTLRAVPVFVGCERAFMRELSQRLKHHGYEAMDQIRFAEPTLCIVTRGTAVRAGRPVPLHHYWGDDIIVSSPALRDHRPGSALTYVEVVCLSRADLLECMSRYDESAQVIRRESLRIAMLRAPQIIARYLRMRSQNPSRRSASERLAPAAAADDVEKAGVDLRVGELKSALAKC